ncbi:MAG: radical SAM protein [Candidatus Thorarchaeota archaeon]|nr:MAG: radical SAM protein [Candidatus Thorarchaeota archaeon]
MNIERETYDHPEMSSDLDMSRFRMAKYPPKQLPYTTKSICPVCLLDEREVNVIDATVFERDGQIMFEKECPNHGVFEDIYWSDAAMFERVMNYWYMSLGLDNPRTQSIHGCPEDCGQCTNHLGHTALGLIDVTSRCNLSCSICFANAEGSGRTYEPEPDQVLEMLKNLRSNLPAPCPAVQFAGGEPTLSKNLPQYIKWADELGFRHIMVATNGIRIAKNPKYLQQLVDAGLKTLYLQFDGITEKPYITARNIDLREVKNQALDSARTANLDGIILVPTVVKGVNDQELGSIIRYALDNRDIVRCINFQPVSITGRIEHEKRMAMRITTPDAIKLIEKQTNGRIRQSDWYPISSMMGVGRAIGLMRGVNLFELHSHFACGMATFLFIGEDNTYYPITEVVDLEKLLITLEEICNLYADGARFPGLRSKVKLMKFLRHVRKKSFMKPVISSFLRSGSYSSLKVFMSKVIMLGIMHFQDPWNIDLERMKHCTINYASPDGRIIPFCTYNSIHRERIESVYGLDAQMPLEKKIRTEMVTEMD